MQPHKITAFQFIGRRRKLFIIGVSIAFSLSIATVVISRIYSAEHAKNRIYTFENVSERPVAIIFGAWVNPDGNPSAMLADRVDVGAKLYLAGKVRALLLTGDNHITTYNEPEAMRKYALTLGVPATALVLDYAGFRTFDSCYRAHTIFGVNQAILVTQAFHLDRALLTCNGLGVDSVGVAADIARLESYAQSNLFISQMREFPSTAFALLDLISDRKPTFLGEQVSIFDNSNSHFFREIHDLCPDD